jgi:hypothetical protein
VDSRRRRWSVSKGRSAECHRPLTWTAEDADGQSPAPSPFCTASDGRMTAECCIHGWDISDPGLIQVLAWELPGGTKENLYEPQSGQPVSLPRFEQSTSRIRV